MVTKSFTYTIIVFLAIRLLFSCILQILQIKDPLDIGLQILKINLFEKEYS